VRRSPPVGRTGRSQASAGSVSCWLVIVAVSSWLVVSLVY
jgi:hypothetical protein